MVFAVEQARLEPSVSPRGGSVGSVVWFSPWSKPASTRLSREVGLLDRWCDFRCGANPPRPVCLAAKWQCWIASVAFAAQQKRLDSSVSRSGIAGSLVWSSLWSKPALTHLSREVAVLDRWCGFRCSASPPRPVAPAAKWQCWIAGVDFAVANPSQGDRRRQE